MWYVVETTGNGSVKSTGFETAAQACDFIVKAGAHNFYWVGTKVTYTIKFEE